MTTHDSKHCVFVWFKICAFVLILWILLFKDMATIASYPPNSPLWVKNDLITLHVDHQPLLDILTSLTTHFNLSIKIDPDIVHVPLSLHADQIPLSQCVALIAKQFNHAIVYHTQDHSKIMEIQLFKKGQRQKIVPLSKWLKYNHTTHPQPQTKPKLNASQSLFFSPSSQRSFLNYVEPDLQPYVVRLQSRYFLPTKNESIEFKKPKKHVYIQFNHIPEKKDRSMLDQMGIHFNQYIGQFTYISQLNHTQLQTLLKLPIVRGVSDMIPQDKLSQNVYHNVAPKYDHLPNGQIKYQATCYQPTHINQTIAQLTKLGSQIHKSQTPHSQILFSVDASKLLAIASMDNIQFIEYAPPLNKEHNALAAAIARIRRPAIDSLSYLSDTDYKLTGNNIAIGVWDSGIIAHHPDLENRVHTLYPQDKPSAHATHVAGTIGGNGSIMQSAKGMAPNAQLYSFNHYTGILPNSIESALLKWQPNMTISNHAYGFPIGWEHQLQSGPLKDYANQAYFGSYQTISKQLDAFVQSYQHTLIFSAGNDRNDGHYAYLLQALNQKTIQSIAIAVPKTCDLKFFYHNGGTVQIGREQIMYQTIAQADPTPLTHPDIAGFLTDHTLISLQTISRGAHQSPIDSHRLIDKVFPLNNSLIPYADGTAIVQQSDSQSPETYDIEFYQTIGPYACAKNVIAVGAIQDDGITLSPYSNFGPTDDGRIKPDLVANGETLFSPSGVSEDSYLHMSGTSMAASVVSGVVALIQEFWNRSENIARLSANTNSAILSVDMIKALLCHTAQDIGPKGPDFQSGFGRVNARAAIDLLNDTLTPGHAKILKNTIHQGQTLTWQLSIPDNSSDIRVTLCWLDPPAFQNAQKKLVQNLDLELIDPNGKIYYPYHVAQSNAFEITDSTGPNSTDPIEMIHVPQPKQGDWFIHIKGTECPYQIQSFTLVSNHPIDQNQWHTHDPFSNLDHLTLSCLNSLPVTLDSDFILSDCVVSEIQKQNIDRILSAQLVLDIEEGLANETFIVKAKDSPISHIMPNPFKSPGKRLSYRVNIPTSMLVQSEQFLPLQLGRATNVMNNDSVSSATLHRADLVITYIKQDTELSNPNGIIQGGFRVFNPIMGWHQTLPNGETFSSGPQTYQRTFSFNDMIYDNQIGQVKAIRMTLIASGIEDNEVALYMNHQPILMLPATGLADSIQSLSIHFPKQALATLKPQDATQYLELKTYSAEDQFTVYYIDFTFDTFMPSDQVPTPQHIRAQALNNKILLEWDPIDEPKESIMGYRVERAKQFNGPYDAISPLPLTNSYFSDDHVINQTTYYYRVVTLGIDQKNSEPSTSIAATPLRLPAHALIKINENALFTTSANVMLSLYADNALEMRIQGEFLEKNGDSGWIPYANVYPVTLQPGDGPKTIYAFFRNQISTQDNDIINASDDIVLSQQPPIPPSPVEIWTGNGIISLYWQPIQNEVSPTYQVYRSDGPGLDFILLTENPTQQNWFEDTTGQLNVTYTYRITTVNRFGIESVIGTEVSLTNGFNATLIPESLTAIGSENQLTPWIKLSWKPTTLTTNTSFDIFRSTDQSNLYHLIATSTTNAYTDTAIENGVIYKYKIRSKIPINQVSPWTSSASAFATMITKEGVTQTNEIWLKDVHLTGDITIPEGQSLDIRNCRVYMNGYRFQIQGSLIADNAYFDSSQASTGTLIFLEHAYASVTHSSILHNNVTIQSSTTSLSSCVIHNPSGIGLSITNYSQPKIESCLFQVNNYPIAIEAGATPIMVNNTYQDNQNDWMLISGKIVSDWQLSGVDHLELHLSNDLIVEPNATLTIQTGLTLYLDNHPFTIYGTLNGHEVCITGENYSDDYVRFENEASGLLTYCQIKHTILSTQTSHVSFQFCTLNNPGQAGIEIQNYAKPTLTECTFLNNAYPMAMIPGSHDNISGCHFINNQSDAMRYYGSILQDFIIDPLVIKEFVLIGPLRIESNASVQIANGTRIQTNGHMIIVNGHLSAQDVSFVGSNLSNESLYFSNNSSGNLMTCQLDQVPVHCDTSHLLISQTRINAPNTYGIYISNLAKPIINECIFETCLVPLWVSAGASPRVSGSQFLNTELQAFFVSGNLETNWTLDVIDGLMPMLSNDLTIDSSGILYIQKRVTLAMNGYSLFINGAIHADNTIFSGNSGYSDQIIFYENSQGQLIASQIVSTTLQISSSDVSFQGGKIIHPSKEGMELRNGAGPTFSNVIFENTLVPVMMDPTCHPTFSSCTYIDNTHQAIFLSGTMTQSSTLEKATDHPYVLNNTLNIPNNITLKLAPGTVIHMNGQSLIINGRLLTDQATFEGTSELTNTIICQDDATVALKQTVLNNITLKTYTNQLSVSDCTFKNPSGAGMYVYDQTQPHIIGCLFSGNQYPLYIEAGGEPLCMNNTYTDNMIQAIAISGLSPQDWIWPAIDQLPFYVENDITIPKGTQTRIPAGTIIKMGLSKNIIAAGKLMIDGQGFSPVVFTSFKDDFLGGDSNGDGASSGAIGDWGFIQLQDSQSILNHCVIQFGSTGIVCKDASPFIQNGTIIYNKNYGIHLSGSQDLCHPTIVNTIIAYNGIFGIYRSLEQSSQRRSTGLKSDPIPLTLKYSAAFNNGVGDYTPDGGILTFPIDDIGPGNMSGNPLFVNSSQGNLSLTSGSPCIDAGDPQLTDLDLSPSDIGAFGDSGFSGPLDILLFDTPEASNSICIRFTAPDKTFCDQGIITRYDIQRSQTQNAYEESFETQDFTHLTWQRTGFIPWTVESIDTIHGTWAAQAIGLSDYHSAALSITMTTGTGTLSFWKKVFTDTHDALVFYIDGISKGRWSGEIDWSQEQLMIHRGDHQFMWVYEKNHPISSENQGVLLDHIIFPPPEESLVFETIGTSPCLISQYTDNAQTSTSPPDNNLAYYYRLLTIYENGNAYTTQTMGPVISYDDRDDPPAAPSNPIAWDTELATNSITLNWVLSNDDTQGQFSVIAYDILRAQTDQGPFSRVGTVGSGLSIYIDQPTNSIEPVINLTNYWYKIRARGGFYFSDSQIIGPVQSINDIPVSIKPVTQVVILDTPNDQGQSITIQWTLSEDDKPGSGLIDRYDIFRSESQTESFMLIGTVLAGQSQFIDDHDNSLSAPQDNVSYWYIVRANAKTQPNQYEDTLPAGPVHAIHDNPIGPAPPTQVTAMDIDNDQGISLFITWHLSLNDTQEASQVTGYNIYRKYAMVTAQDDDYPLNAFELIGTVPAGTDEFIDTQVIPGTYYHYMVRAMSQTNASIDSNETLPISPIDNVPPQPITQLSFVAEPTACQLFWQKPVDEDYDHFVIHLGQESKTYSTQIITGLTPNYRLTDLMPETAYYVVVTTVDSHGLASNYSQEIIIQTSAKDTIPPDALQSFHASDWTEQRVKLSWIAPGDDQFIGTASRYDCRLSETSITQQTFIHAQPISGEPNPLIAGTSQSVWIEELKPDTTYYFACVAYDDQDNASIMSNVVMIHTDLTPPTPVNDLRVKRAEYTTLTLGWTARGDNGDSGQASAYDLRYSSDPITDTTFEYAQKVNIPMQPNQPGSDETIDLSDLDQEQSYYFAIKIVDESGNQSALSNIAIGASRKIDTPVITALVQDHSIVGSKIRLYGHHFGMTQDTSIVYFYQHVPAPIYKWNDTAIECYIPEYAESGDLLIQTAGGVSNGIYVHISQDMDEDGMADDWEALKGLNTSEKDAHLDNDQDGLTNGIEYYCGTDPNVHNATYADSDNDNLPDIWEYKYGLIAGSVDSYSDHDADGLNNLIEYFNGTSPMVPNMEYSDQDDDLLIDRWEKAHYLDPTKNDAYLDPDMDGIPNITEYKNGTDPRNIASHPTQHAPEIDAIGLQQTAEDTPSQFIDVTIRDQDGGLIILWANSTNTDLVAHENILFAGQFSTYSMLVLPDQSETLTLQITPKPDRYGDVSIVLFIKDTAGAISSMHFTFRVNPVNDAPILQTQGTTYFTSIAKNDTNNNGNSISHLLMNTLIQDKDGPSTKSIAVISVDHTHGQWQYSLDNGITWKATSQDIGASINLLSKAILLDANPTGLYTQRIRFVPSSGYNGVSRLSFCAWDKSQGVSGQALSAIERGVNTPFSEAIVNSDIKIGNQPPIAQDFTISTQEDNAINSMFQIIDEDSSSFQIMIITQPVLGSLQVNQPMMGYFSYSPALNKNGMDQFTYSVSDGESTSLPAQVRINIEPINDPPVARDITLFLDEDETIFNNLLLASDPDNEPLRYRVIDKALKGVVQLNSETGLYTYIPNANANGDDQFTYVAEDKTIYSNIATVRVKIQPKNDAPEIIFLPDISVPGNQIIGPIDLFIQDIDNALNSLSITVRSSNTMLIPNESIQLLLSHDPIQLKCIPVENQIGQTKITLRVSDGNLFNERSFIITVNKPLLPGDYNQDDRIDMMDILWLMEILGKTLK